MLVYTYMYKNHSSNPGHGPKSRLTMFSAPLGILETQELSWVQVQSSGSPCYTASILHLLQGELGTRGFASTPSLPQSPNTHSRHTLHSSRNQEGPFPNVLNSITKATLLCWFCITTANRSPQSAPSAKLIKMPPRESNPALLSRTVQCSCVLHRNTHQVPF